ncbi:MAG: hypothetical protein WCK34_09555 [Bacteroidota bacterium]
MREGPGDVAGKQGKGSMMTPGISWPAKLLLFGEYSILLGSSALSMPFRSFSAILRFWGAERDDTKEGAEESNFQLKKFYEYLAESPGLFGKFLDLERFRSDLSRGLCLSSDIPQRYGMGSSGALCAAVYGRYAFNPYDDPGGKDNTHITALRSLLAAMETFFHGRSSGFDPLVIFLQKTLLLGKNDDVVPVDIPVAIAGHPFELILVDSGLPGSTGPRVQEFLDRFLPGGNIIPAGSRMVALSDDCIDRYLAGNTAAFGQAITKLSRFQLANLEHLIPAHLRPSWGDGLDSGLFSLKLCGSGGGGFIICFTRDSKKTIDYFRKSSIPVLKVAMPRPGKNCPQ